MSVTNNGGHGVTNQAGQHNTQAAPAQPNFVPAQGPSDHNMGGSKKKSAGNYPPANGK